MSQALGTVATAMFALLFVANAVFMLISPDAYTRLFPDWRFQKRGQPAARSPGPLAISSALTTRIRGSFLLATTLWCVYLMLHKIW